jgi:hypothetical protein
VKEFAPRNSTEAGRQIDISDEHLKSALDSIPLSLDPDSKINEQSDWHSQKLLLPRISI